MMEVWSTVGFILLDKALHEKLFSTAILGQKFEDLEQFRNILRVTMRLNLSRFEVMLIRQILTERHISINLPPDPILSTEEDIEINAIRQGWPGPIPDYPDDFHLCAVIGLASMDIAFRTDLHNQSDSDAPQGVKKLEAFLKSPTGENPTFNPSQVNLANLNRFLRAENDTMAKRLERFHYTRWVQPNDFPCYSGYTVSAAPLQYFPQSALNRIAAKRPEMLDVLRGFTLLE